MTTTPEREALAPKLENIISGHRINDDDAAWLRALLAASPAAGVPQPHPLTDESRARLTAYVARRKKSRGLDIESIHGFDVCPEGGFELRLSDIEALLAATPPAAPAQAMPQAEKRAPVQGYAPGIPWSLHLEAYAVYCKKWSPQPALIEGWCRGGFHTNELDEFIPGWRDRAALVSQEGAAK